MFNHNSVNFIQQNSSNGRLYHYLWRHVVCDAELQVCEDALHAVESLLPGGSQVFLHGPGHRGKNSLSRLPRIHHLPRVFGGRGELLFMEALDVREGLLHRHDQPR